MFIASACLIAGSVAVSLVLPVVFSFLRAWIILLKIPSPPVGGYIFGHAKYLTTTSRHKYEEECFRKLGPVYRIRALYAHIVHVGAPALAKEVFEMERIGLVEKPNVPPGFHRGKGKDEMNVFNEKTKDPMWMIVRKGTAAAFIPNNMRRYQLHVVEVVDRLIACIKAKGPGAVIDIADIGQRESFDVIGMVGFGKDFGASRNIDNTANHPCHLLTNFLEEAVKQAGNPMRIHSRSKEVQKRRAEYNALMDIMASLVDESQARCALEDEPSIVGHLHRLRDPEGQPLSKARLIQEFFIIFLAGVPLTPAYLGRSNSGHDALAGSLTLMPETLRALVCNCAGSETTGHTIAWTLYFLVKHPKVMAKLEAELDEAGLLVSARNPDPRPFDYEDIGRLRYLDQVLKESMRLQPVASLPLVRMAERDLHFSNGMVIPRGVLMEVAQYMPMRGAHTGWAHGELFLPERWEERGVETFDESKLRSSTGAAGPAEDGAHHRPSSKARRFHPFGQGMRTCLGMQLARMNLPCALAKFVSAFKLELTPEDAAKSLADLECLKGTLQPRDGIHMICTPRGI